jgi:hypothetical protein
VVASSRGALASVPSGAPPMKGDDAPRRPGCGPWLQRLRWPVWLRWPGSPGWARRLGWCGWLGLAALAVARVAGQAGDDIYITYRYADNLARGRALVFNPGERVFGVSDPGVAVLLAGLHRVSGVPIPDLGTGVTAAAMLAIAGMLLAAGRGGGREAEAWAGGTLLLTSAYVWLGQGSGPLPALALLLLAARLAGGRWPWAAGAVAGLAFCCRPDAALGAALLALLLVVEASRRAPGAAAAPEPGGGGPAPAADQAPGGGPGADDSGHRDWAADTARQGGAAGSGILGRAGCLQGMEAVSSKARRPGPNQHQADQRREERRENREQHDIEAAAGAGREEHRPQEVAVAFHPLTRVVDKPQAVREVDGIAEGDVGVVNDQIGIEKATDADREQNRRGSGHRPAT